MEAITQESDSIVRPTQSFKRSAPVKVRSKRASGALWGFQLQYWQIVLKRTIDICGAFIGLMLLLPVGLIVALFIKLNSRGPLLYKQVRIGKDERRFEMLKFRSMYADADVLLKEILDTDPVLREEYARFHKLRNDPRITPVGRVIRKYSIDELPQFWNVLKGDMSLVGPRPYMPSELYKMRGRGARTILSVRPGLTGLWQTNGRNKLLFYERLELDVEYVEKWSLLLDARLLWRTIPVILKGEGAS
jgi:lipopolysaccharide/colanic/teichoic acid biosynthesis glycosyltransferase